MVPKILSIYSYLWTLNSKHKWKHQIVRSNCTASALFGLYFHAFFNNITHYIFPVALHVQSCSLICAALQRPCLFSCKLIDVNKSQQEFVRQILSLSKLTST